MTRLGSVTIQSLGEDGVVFADDSTGQKVVIRAEFVGDAAAALQYFRDCRETVTETNFAGSVKQIHVTWPPPSTFPPVSPDVWAEE